jgi:hypothetical protein
MHRDPAQPASTDNLPTPAPDRRRPSKLVRRGRIAAVLALALLPAVLFGTSIGAGADTQDSVINANCAFGALNLPVTLNVSATDTPDPVNLSSPLQLDLVPSLPAIGSLVVTVNEATITVPIPEGIASVNDVQFVGGNVAASYSLGAGVVILTFTGPVQSNMAQLPTVQFFTTVAANAPATIQWKTFTAITAAVTLNGINLNGNCTPTDPNQILQTTTVIGGATTTTSSSTSTTSTSTTSTSTTSTSTTSTSTTSTTTSTTSSSTTSTTQAPTTTSRRSTTTSSSSTTSSAVANNSANNSSSGALSGARSSGSTGSSGRLPLTGLPVLPALVTASILIGTGGAAVAASRRRRGR